jgi:hypothetical protein
MGLLDRFAARRTEPAPLLATAAPAADSVFASKALRKFLAVLAPRPTSVVMDLGPVVGSNVTFFGEQFDCRVGVEDLYADLDRHTRQGTLDDLPVFLAERFRHPAGSVDGVLCWDLFDYLDRRAAQALAAQIIRVLRPDGVAFGLFGTAKPGAVQYTKYVIVDESRLQYRSYASARGRQAILANRDILKLFETLRVSDSFLLKNNVREILFRKPA